MKTKLTWKQMVFRGVRPLGESSVPAILGGHILQNTLEFDLDEYEEIFEGYGTLKGSYPYRQQDDYDRELIDVEYSVAILENDYLCATFIIDLGGRLWSLIDKVSGKNLLYTNDVIRFSNLSSRNAWFSGGVEWNVGIVGHTPFTCERIFASRATLDDGTTVLRLYEHERIRAIEYQMDFILKEDDRALTCRMKMVNSSSQVIPGYWWSNIAVPEFAKGRLVVPATSAYFCDMIHVQKVPSPKVSKDCDISHYKQIVHQSDFFFALEKKKPRYIVHLDENGKGLLHLSSDRLQARKLFTWGDNPGADSWQAFLTESAGRYIEIQAGIAKTQYGCLPMPPNTSWDWIEQYGPITVPKELMECRYEELELYTCKVAEKQLQENDLEEMLIQTRLFSKMQSTLMVEGSSYGALNRYAKDKSGEKNLSSHLDFGKITGPALQWKHLIDHGVFDIPDPSKKPEDYLCSKTLYEALVLSVEDKNKGNWYAYYQIALYDFWKSDYQRAKSMFQHSNALNSNAWNLHGLAVVSLVDSAVEDASEYIKEGLALVPSDISYIKETFRILQICEHYEDILEVFEVLDREARSNKRLTYSYCLALYKTGMNQKAWDLMTSDGGLILEDTREGQNVVADLYRLVSKALFGRDGEVPENIDFNALGGKLSSNL